MGDVTELLERWSRGDAEAFKSLMPMVYDELHKLAAHYLNHERRDHTLQPTALVHEAYLRLSGLREMRLHNRTHFYGASAEVMRRVLIDHARRRNALKRGSGDVRRFPAGRAGHADRSAAGFRRPRPRTDAARRVCASKSPCRRAALLRRPLSRRDRRVSQLSAATVKRHWRFARAWLLTELRGNAAVTPTRRNCARSSRFVIRTRL